VGGLAFKFLLLLKKILKRRPSLKGDGGLTNVALGILIRRKEVAKICPLAVSDPLCLRLSTSIVSSSVVVRTVQAAMNIIPALRTFFGPGDITGFKL